MSGEGMEGKTVLVTGATSGIGEVTALELARLGARVVVHGRSEARARRTVDRIRSETGDQGVEYLLADLQEQAQVRRLARDFLARHERLDVLVNNAGAIFVSRELTPDGIERTWAVNHLACFLLTHSLFDTLKASAPARVVNVASSAHWDGRLHFDDVGLAGAYGPMKAYGQSKLANLMFTFELARRLEGSGVTANAVHPGLVRTGLATNNGLLVGLLARLAMLSGVSPQKGAETVVYLAASPEVEGVSGGYFVNRRPAPTSQAARDESAQRRLWDLSERMTA